MIRHLTLALTAALFCSVAQACAASARTAAGRLGVLMLVLFMAIGPAPTMANGIIEWQCGNVRVRVSLKLEESEHILPRSRTEYLVTGLEQRDNRFIWADEGLYLNDKLCWPIRPVTCLRPDGTAESCESRQTPLPKPRPAEAPAPIPFDKTVLYYEPGGRFKDHMERWKTLALSGDHVEIRGPCISGCTLILMHVPDNRLCFSGDASLQFHLAWDPEANKASMMLSKWMVDNYPRNIRTWLTNNGGVEKMSVDEFWILEADELWTMGYRKCGPESVVPMTIVQPTDFWREKEKAWLRDEKTSKAWSRINSDELYKEWRGAPRE
jgi:hypothetical protein